VPSRTGRLGEPSDLSLFFVVRRPPRLKISSPHIPAATTIIHTTTSGVSIPSTPVVLAIAAAVTAVAAVAVPVITGVALSYVLTDNRKDRVRTYDHVSNKHTTKETTT